MTATLTAADRPAKDRSGAFAVPPPGPQLVRWLEGAARAGRPVLHSIEYSHPSQHPDRLVRYELVVPLLPWTAESHGPPLALRPLVLLATQSGLAAELATENARDRAQLRLMAAAVLRDIGGLGEDEVGAHLGLPHPESARRAAKHGRLLWAHLGAWPWWGARWWFKQTPGSALPKSWWENELARDGLNLWLSGGGRPAH